MDNLKNDAGNSVYRFGRVVSVITNKDRLCEERTTILSIGWTSPAHEQVLFI